MKEFWAETMAVFVVPEDLLLAGEVTVLNDTVDLTWIDAEVQDSAAGLVDWISAFADHDSAFGRIKRLHDLSENGSDFGDRLIPFDDLAQMGQHLEESSFVSVSPIRSVAKSRFFDWAQQGAWQHFQVHQLVNQTGQALSNDTVLKLMGILKFGSDRVNSPRCSVSA